MSVWGASRLKAAPMAATMAGGGVGGKGGGGAFPKAFAGLTGAAYLRREELAQSALQQRFDPLVEFGKGCLAFDLLAIEEKGRRRINLQHLAGVFLVGRDLVEQGLVLEAILDGLLAETGLLADPDQGLGGVLQH